MLSFCCLGEEMSECDFGDERLNKRACSIVDTFSSHPNVSIPAAFSSRSDLEACYRFFDNESVTPEKILRPHIEATYKRIERIDFVLLVQDTTEIDLTRPKQQVRGAGPMDCESRRGAFYHPVVAFTESGVALGIVGQKAWTRTAISKDDDKTKQAKRRKTPIEDKESFR